MPENHGIYDTRTYMEQLANWVCETGNDAFRRTDLPDYLRCKWFNRASYNKELVPVSKTCRGANAWRLGVKWQRMANAGPIAPRQEITDELLIETVASGANTYRQLKEELRWSTATIYRYLSSLVDAGVLVCEKKGRAHVYRVATP